MFRKFLLKAGDIIIRYKFLINKPVEYLNRLSGFLKSGKPSLVSTFNRVKFTLYKLPAGKYVFDYLKSLTVDKIRLVIFLTSAITIIISTTWILTTHPKLYKLNVRKTMTIYIHGNSNYKEVLENLKSQGILENVNTFNWLAIRKNYPANIKPGAYRLEEGWSNKKILDILSSGNQTPVKVTFNSIRLRENLAGRLSRSLEPDSASFLTWLNNDSLANSMGFTHENFPVIFIPNTYEFYWTTSPKKFVERMKNEFDIFWNEGRRSKARKLGLSIQEVVILASIIQEETNMQEEKPKIAGVYLNRLRKNWNLQADPTIRFAMGDFTIKRILHQYTFIDSPYNTYKYKGLPPGPINFPEIQSIEAVLNSEINDYMYFCAKDDFSGYHNFSKTLSEHLKYARKYQEALNRNKILR
jgi:UPF0755 protein